VTSSTASTGAADHSSKPSTSASASPAAPVDAVLDVTSAYARKEEALRCYPVALESMDYATAARGLATYRGVTAGLGPAALAEGFLRLPAAEHATVARQVAEGRGRS
jgi:hypothetical protein